MHCDPHDWTDAVDRVAKLDNGLWTNYSPAKGYGLIYDFLLEVHLHGPETGFA
jgi:hypothetical protein